MESQSNKVHRAVVEHLVRQAVYQRMGKLVPATGQAPNPWWLMLARVTVILLRKRLNHFLARIISLRR